MQHVDHVTWFFEVFIRALALPSVRSRNLNLFARLAGPEHGSLERTTVWPILHNSPLRNAQLQNLRVGLVSNVELIVTDLPNNLLGLAAAGFGWFVDSTPDTDEEFELNSHESSYSGAAAGRMDLLTVLAHELGHLLGFEHDTAPGHLMSETLAPGTRLLPIGSAADIDNVFSNPVWP